MILRIFLIFSLVFHTISSNCQISYFLSNKFWRLKQATINGREYNFNEQNSNAPTLQFTDGNIRGNGGCNAYHTKFTINSNTLDVNRVMSTRMACNDLYLNENDYFNALAQMHQLFYTEGSSEFKLVNQNNDQMTFFAQFARSGNSYTPPPRKVYNEESEDRLSRRHRAEKPEKKLSKKELARKKLLEKKMNSRKSKLTKKEKRELMALQSKTKSVKSERIGKKGKKNRRDKEEKRGGKKGKKNKNLKSKDKKSKEDKKKMNKVKDKKAADKKKGKKKKK